MSRKLSEGMEQWLPVVGYLGHYEVSDCGRVRSVDRQVGSRWETSQSLKGQALTLAHETYVRVSLSKGGEVKKTSVHRMVATAFLPPCPNDMNQVNHIDGNKHNNTASNLEWSNSSLNQLHAYANGLSNWNYENRSTKLNPEKAVQIRDMDNLGYTQYDIARLFKIDQSTVSDVITGRSWKIKKETV